MLIRSATTGFLLGISLLAAGWPAWVRAADPQSAVYSRDGSRLFWILQISDSHIGSEWYDEASRFTWAMQEALPVIQPELVINTGDLCDGSVNGVPATGQSEEEWSLYRQIVDDAGVPPDFYLDLPGNHDLYGDPGFSFYLDWSFYGSTYGTTTQSLSLELPFGDYFIYGCSTAGDEGYRLVDTHAFSEDELQELESELTAHDDAELILVFGHHPPGTPDNASQAVATMNEHGAIYFHGHSHIFDTYVHDGLLTFEVDSLGKAQSDNLAVIAVDNNFVSYAVTDSEDPWPLVVITAPADIHLHSGQENPYAYLVCVGGEDNPVRALAFDTTAVTQVHFRIDDGDTVPMTRDDTVPMLWHGSWDTRGLAPGQVTLTVTAGTVAYARSRSITVRLAEVPCPGETTEEPDGGWEDGGEDDGGFPDGGEETPADEAGDGGDPEEDAGADGEPLPDDGGEDAGIDAGSADASTPGDPGIHDGDSHPAGGCGCGREGQSCPTALVLLLLAWMSIRRSRP